MHSNHTKHLNLVQSPSKTGQYRVHTSSERPLHYLSICSLVGKTRDWIHHGCSDVQILILGTSIPSQTLQSIPLGCGRFRITLNCHIIGTFWVLAVCRSCQAVMHMANTTSFPFTARPNIACPLYRVNQKVIYTI